MVLLPLGSSLTLGDPQGLLASAVTACWFPPGQCVGQSVGRCWAGKPVTCESKVVPIQFWQGGVSAQLWTEGSCFPLWKLGGSEKSGFL